MNTELRAGLVALLREADQAYRASAASQASDADWALWYAGFLQEPLTERLGMAFRESRLIYCLMNADREHEARAPDSDRAEFFADLILERCAPSETPADDKLALYHFDGCPFCYMVQAAIEQLDVDVEYRNIHEDRRHLDDLIAARGRATVPVLRITSPGGEDRWMPESRDIIRYLETL